ncbi:MAG: D-alanyl-D-alanine carboxypeptidase/D-alanyl-D-alanine-endopeptidase [Chitinispirillaceae bacterium]|nr:D-alanyl-D-alanine carboxypeptidase/D-alanyl-D-alanine-endopeptidase [Chitinispirillaceae bacterium]
MRITSAVFVMLLVSVCAGEMAAPSAGNIQSAVESIIASGKYPLRSVGVVVAGAAGAPIVSVNGDSMYNPASVTKLITAAAAFERLGTTYCCTTRVFTDSIISQDSMLSVHDLYLQGAGDPGFTAERLWLFAEQLCHRGLRSISGDLVLDDFAFDSLSVGPGFGDEGEGSRAYAPLISALAVNWNTVAVYQRPGSRAGQPVIVRLFPEVKGMAISNTAVTVAGSGRLETATIAGTDNATTVTVRGTMGMHDEAEYSYRKLWQTWESFGNALVPLFERRGVTLEGRVVHRKVPVAVAKQPPLLAFVSEPLIEPVNAMFKYSSNFCAEMVFKNLSRDSIGSWDRSEKIVAQWWKKQKLPGAPLIRNGSGMGENRISPSQIVALLCHVQKQPGYWPDYLAALSSAGIDGTVKSRFTKSPLRGRVRAKTGTLNDRGVSTLAGYLLLPDSRTMAFAIFCSRGGQGQTADWNLQERILEKVAESVR